MSTNDNFPPLTLKRFDANHINHAKKIKNDDPIPDMKIINQYRYYPHLIHAENVAERYVKHILREQSTLPSHWDVPQNIVALCKKYYFAEEDGLYQFAYKLCGILNKLNKSSINEKALKLVIMKYYKLKHSEFEEVGDILTKLVKLEFIVPVNLHRKHSSSKNTHLYEYALSTFILLQRRN